MFIGCIGDTHDVEERIIKDIVCNELLPRGVEVAIHTGDIEIQHVSAELFSNLPMTCVLTKQQSFDPDFSYAPKNWRFVRPAYWKDKPEFIGKFTDELANACVKELITFNEQQRIFCRLVPIKVDNEMVMAYCGHERSFDIFKNSQRVQEFFTEINQVYDGVRLAVSGHMHRQFIWRHGNLLWVNPGSIIESMNRTREFAVVNTANWEVVCGRLTNAEAKIEPVTIGIISDTGNIDELDRSFWQRLKVEFDNRGVSYVICCGDFRPSDVGRLELANCQVYYYLLPEFASFPDPGPANWHRISYDNPVIDICGHQFYIQHEIGPEQANFSDIERHCAFDEIRKRYKHLDFIVTGLVSDTIVQEADKYFFINPGDAKDHRNFATLCLPRSELTVGTVPDC